MSKMPNNQIATMYVSANSRTVIYDRESEMFWRYINTVWQPFIWNDFVDSIGDFCEEKNLDGNFTQATFKDIAEQCRRKVRHMDELDDRWISFNDCLFSPETFDTFPHPIPPKELSKKILATTPEKRNDEILKYENIYTERIATIRIPYEYKTLGDCKMPIFRKYLNDCCKDDKGEHNLKMEHQLQEGMGYVMTPEMAAKAFIYYGDGGTGKSVLLSIKRSIVSKPRTMQASLEDITKKDFILPSLIGKRALIKDEEHASSCDMAKLKTIIAGEIIDTRRLYGEQFSFVPKVKMYFGSQRFPRLDGFDNSIKRRFLIIPFNNIVPDEERILHLDKKILKAGELPAIVLWALEGLKRLKENNFKFTKSEDSERAMDEFKATSSSVAEYLIEFYDTDGAGKIPFKEVYDGYCEWCKDSNRKPVSSNRFGRESASVLGKTKSMSIGGKTVRGFMAVKKGEEQAVANF